MVILTKLFEPLNIKLKSGRTITLRNRIVMPPMDSNLGDANGNVINDTLKYYEQRAKGGTALIIVEGTYIEKRGQQTSQMLSMESDDKIEGLSKLAQTIKKHGAVASIQLFHAGGQTSKLITNIEPISASQMSDLMMVEALGGHVEKIHILNKEEIQEVVKMHGDAAERCKKAGFDGIEIHGAHGYIINQFLSPNINKRTDEYGGSLENRMRFLIEIYNEIRNRIGDDFLISVRLNGSDYIEGGFELEETIQVAKKMEELGANIISISCGTHSSLKNPMIPYMSFPKGFNVERAASVKQVLTKTPVITVGRINTPKLANEIIEKGKADLVAIGRGLIADPQFPLKAKEERMDIKTCIACNTCITNLMWQKPIECAVNPNLFGVDDDIQKAKDIKKVLIIGAGPGGLEAAKVAKLRGHDVLLIEKSGKIGGNLYIASVAPIKEEVKNIISYYNQVFMELGVNVKLNMPFSEKILDDYKPDHIILATGSEPILPEIEGLSKVPYKLYSYVLEGEIPKGQNIAIIGGGMVGLEVAEYLADKKKKVVVVEMLKNLGANVQEMVKNVVIPLINENENITTYLRTKITEIKENTLIGTQKKNDISIKFDDLIIATGVKSNDKLEEEIKSKFPNLKKIGDCKKPRKIVDAVKDGYKAALKI
ncbi:MAG: FAD-dependent oxidoreductase [Candidatus Lokiarchaeota archaeon]|nr:FAD-dependent oxidoreductase [Candidatus Lokiarchaeota archaeon]